MIGWALRESIKRKVQPLSDAAKEKVAAVKAKASRGKKKLGEMRRKGIRDTRNRILPILPGVSRLKLPESPVPHLLLTNDPPIDEKIAVVQDVIAKASDEEQSMRRKIFIKSLSNGSHGYWRTVTDHKIDRVVRFIQQHRGVVSAQRRLPPEIIQEIFIWFACPRTHSRWTSNSELPWVLGQVCRSWRASALSLSSLWSHLPTIDLAKSDPRARTKLQVEYLDELLRRSRFAPLDIYIFSLGFSGTRHPVIDLLTRHCERWQVLTVKMNTASLPRLREIKGRLPRLESLNLYLSGYEEGIPTIDMFDGAPQLRQVDVGGPFLAELSLPFSQLAHYKDKIRMRNSITRVVTAANSLEALTVLELCESSSTPPIPAVTLPALKKLQVKFCCTRPDFLSNLTAPILEEIKLVSYHDEGNLIPSLITIISNSSTPCVLKILRFRTHSVRAGQLPELLRLTPDLRTLDMPIPPAADINAFAYDRLAPRLESCEFFIDDVIGTSHDAQINAALNAVTMRCEVLDVDFESDEKLEHDVIVPSPQSDLPPLVVGGLRPLKKFMIHFDRSRWIPAQQAALEGWPASVGSERLRNLKAHLHEELPELDARRPRRVRKLDKMWVERVRQWLEEIEDMEVVDVRDIYVSECFQPGQFFLWICIDQGPFTGFGNTFLNQKTERTVDSMGRQIPFFRKMQEYPHKVGTSLP